MLARPDARMLSAWPSAPQRQISAQRRHGACASSSATASIARVSALVLALARRLEAASIPGIVEMVPTFRSLMVHYDPLALAAGRAEAAKLAPLLRGPRTGRRAPVGGGACRPAMTRACRPDLADVAERTGLTPQQVIERHSATTYHVYMMGFLPGLSLHGRPAARARAAAAGKPAHEGAAGLHRHRHGT